jgi:hypothetical protein
MIMSNFSQKSKRNGRLLPLAFLALVSLLLIYYSFFTYDVYIYTPFPPAKSFAHSKTIPLNPRKDFSTFSEANEVVRSRFLEKRATKMFGKNGEMSPLLWGSSYVWQYFPPTWTCPHLLQRVGHPSDGGKWVCGLELFEGMHNSIIISNKY